MQMKHFAFSILDVDLTPDVRRTSSYVQTGVTDVKFAPEFRRTFSVGGKRLRNQPQFLCSHLETKSSSPA